MLFYHFKSNEVGGIFSQELGLGPHLCHQIISQVVKYMGLFVL